MNQPAMSNGLDVRDRQEVVYLVVKGVCGAHNGAIFV